MNPFLATDGYKTGHHLMYPKGTSLVYSNFTPRSGKHAGYDSKGVVSFGQQMVMKQINTMFYEHFFSRLKEEVCGEIKKDYSAYLGTDYDVSHIESLWELGHLPIKVKSLLEGTFCPYRVPILTIYNTLPEFYWLTNFLETLISNLLWKPITSATTALRYKQILTEAARKTDEKAVGFVEFQGHDFSMRGMDSIDATISSGLGHATSFLGSDSLPVIHGARKYYGETGPVVHSVNATEHSVMCAGTKDDEIGTFRELMKTFPTGILSVVSDTWDLWKVLRNYLPELKDEILARDGKIVIRPDSGDPVDILCGFTPTFDTSNVKTPDSHPERFGVIELLWGVFGGTTNEQGYKILNPHIGAIYGDSITLTRAKEICKRLEAKGFASTNVVLGIGSYTYQYNTRDTHGFAMKATYVEVTEVFDGKDGHDVRTIGREIFKDPVTDDGIKKSAKGLLSVYKHGETGEYILQDQEDWVYESKGHLQTIFEDGKFFNEVTLTEIRERVNKLVLIKPKHYVKA